MLRFADKCLVMPNGDRWWAPPTLLCDLAQPSVGLLVDRSGVSFDDGVSSCTGEEAEDEGDETEEGDEAVVLALCESTSLEKAGDSE